MSSKICEFKYNFCMEFKDIIKEIMEDEGLNQVQFAKKLDIPQGQLSNWITGRSAPSFYHLQNICKKLDISGDRILGLKEN